MNPFINLFADPMAPYALGFVGAVLAILLTWLFTRSDK